MKAYKLEILVVDTDGLGAEEIKQVLESTRYPNWCISPSVMKVEERDIGEWDDDHPLNQNSTIESEYQKLFNT